MNAESLLNVSTFDGAEIPVALAVHPAAHVDGFLLLIGAQGEHEAVLVVNAAADGEGAPQQAQGGRSSRPTMALITSHTICASSPRSHSWASAASTGMQVASARRFSYFMPFAVTAPAASIQPSRNAKTTSAEACCMMCASMASSAMLPMDSMAPS